MSGNGVTSSFRRDPAASGRRRSASSGVLSTASKTPDDRDRRKPAWFRSLALAVLAVSAIAPAHALTVFEVPYASQADIKVYRARYASEADLRIHWVRYRSEAKGDALWWPAPYASQAQVKIHYVKYASQADLKIYEADYASQAGWNGPARGLGIR